MSRYALYRIFAADRVLLYVGSSTCPLIRVMEHSTKKAWREAIATVEIEWLENKNAAREAEKAAIRDESPVFNIHHKHGTKTRCVGVYSKSFRADDPSTWIAEPTP